MLLFLVVPDLFQRDMLMPPLWYIYSFTNYTEIEFLYESHNKYQIIFVSTIEAPLLCWRFAWSTLMFLFFLWLDTFPTRVVKELTRSMASPAWMHSWLFWVVGWYPRVCLYDKWYAQISSYKFGIQKRLSWQQIWQKLYFDSSGSYSLPPGQSFQSPKSWEIFHIIAYLSKDRSWS